MAVWSHVPILRFPRVHLGRKPGTIQTRNVRTFPVLYVTSVVLGQWRSKVTLGRISDCSPCGGDKRWFVFDSLELFFFSLHATLQTTFTGIPMVTVTYMHLTGKLWPSPKKHGEAGRALIGGQQPAWEIAFGDPLSISGETTRPN